MKKKRLFSEPLKLFEKNAYITHLNNSRKGAQHTNIYINHFVVNHNKIPTSDPVQALAWHRFNNGGERGRSTEFAKPGKILIHDGGGVGGGADTLKREILFLMVSGFTMSMKGEGEVL